MVPSSVAGRRASHTQTRFTVSVIVLSLMLAACGGNENGVDSVSLMAHSVSGSARLNGTWTSVCRMRQDVGGQPADTTTSRVFSGSSYSASMTFYSSTDASCTGTSQSISIVDGVRAGYLATLVAVIAAWSDGTTSPSTPPAKLGGGALPTMLAPTLIGYTVSAAQATPHVPAGSYSMTVYVDDSGTPNRMYSDTDQPAACAPSAGGSCLHSLDYLVRQ